MPCKTSFYCFCFITPAILVSNRNDGTLSRGKQQIGVRRSPSLCHWVSIDPSPSNQQLWLWADCRPLERYRPETGSAASTASPVLLTVSARGIAPQGRSSTARLILPEAPARPTNVGPSARGQPSAAVPHSGENSSLWCAILLKGRGSNWKTVVGLAVAPGLSNPAGKSSFSNHRNKSNSERVHQSEGSGMAPNPHLANLYKEAL